MNQTVLTRAYTRTAVLLHWLLALGVLMQFGLGWWMRTLPDKTGVQAYWFNLHKSLGLTVFLIAALLLVWRCIHRPPPLPDTMPMWQRRAAKACHYGLYICVLIMPITGYMGSSFTRFPIRFWGMTLPNFWGWESAELKALCSLVHLSTVMVFMALAGIHIAAALFHLMNKHDPVFRRMWSWKRQD